MSPGKKEEGLTVDMQDDFNTIGCRNLLWPVPAAVKNSWKAEEPDRAVNVTTGVSTGASLEEDRDSALGIWVAYHSNMHHTTQ